MAAKLTKTTHPGIFRRHAKDCTGGRCDCAYVVVWRHRGKQHKATYRTLTEAREAKGNRDAGDRRPVARRSFEDYFSEWIETYAGRTARGFSETTRPEYRRPIEAHAMPRWGTWKLAEIEPADARDLFGAMRKKGATTSAIKKLRAALSAMFATAVEDGLIRSNPVQGVRIPAPSTPEPEDGRAKALTREELTILLAALPDKWRLFHEFLAVTGLRISECIGLRWEHLDLGDSPSVAVREQFYKGQRKKLKSNAGRRDIPLSRDMAGQLLAHRRDTYTAPRSPVFPSRTGTELLPANVYRRVLAPTAIALGHAVEVEDSKGKTRMRSTVSFHTFRHTCASLLFDEGRNVKQVSSFLGHADPGFTLRTYVHLLDAGVGGGLDLAGGNTGATQRPETAANREPAEAPENALFAGEKSK